MKYLKFFAFLGWPVCCAWLFALPVAGQNDSEAAACQVYAQTISLNRKKSAYAWAGHYRAGGTSFQVMPEIGFAYQFAAPFSKLNGDYFSDYFDYGDLVVIDGVVKLYPVRGRLQNYEWQPVSWGPRQYLIPTNRLLDFVNAVNAGCEERADAPRSFPLLEGDEKKSVVDLPALPDTVRDYLRPQPVTARITEVGGATREIIKGTEYQITRATINAGSKDGVWEGMRLFSPGLPADTLIEVKLAGAEAAEITVAEKVETPAAMAKATAGMSLSTRLSEPQFKSGCYF